jgi:hypothetical protein
LTEARQAPKSRCAQPVTPCEKAHGDEPRELPRQSLRGSFKGWKPTCKWWNRYGRRRPRSYGSHTRPQLWRTSDSGPAVSPPTFSGSLQVRIRFQDERVAVDAASYSVSVFPFMSTGDGDFTVQIDSSAGEGGIVGRHAQNAVERFASGEGLRCEAVKPGAGQIERFAVDRSWGASPVEANGTTQQNSCPCPPFQVVIHAEPGSCASKKFINVAVYICSNKSSACRACESPGMTATMEV